MSKFDENYKLTDARSSINPKQNRKNTMKHIIIKLFKISDKEKDLKAARVERHVIYKRLR